MNVLKMSEMQFNKSAAITDSNKSMILRFYCRAISRTLFFYCSSVLISESRKGQLASTCHAAENIYNRTHHIDKHIVLRLNSDPAAVINDLGIPDIRKFQDFPHDLRCLLLRNLL